MSTSDLITLWGIAIGLFLTIIGSAFMIVFKVGGLHEKVIAMEKTLDRVVMLVDQMRIEMTEIQVKLDILWRHHTASSKSPLSLNEEGLRALETSNIGSFAEQHYEEILSRVKALKPENTYQAQELLISIVSRYKKVDEYRLALQESAFVSGHDIDSLLFVAALSIRDRVVSELGFDR